MSLDAQGKISAVTLALYLPILFLALRITYRYGLGERGWLLLVIFSLSESRRRDPILYTYNFQSGSSAVHY